MLYIYFTWLLAGGINFYFMKNVCKKLPYSLFKGLCAKSLIKGVKISFSVIHM